MKLRVIIMCNYDFVFGSFLYFKYIDNFNFFYFGIFNFIVF